MTKDRGCFRLNQVGQHPDLLGSRLGRQPLRQLAVVLADIGRDRFTGQARGFGFATLLVDLIFEPEVDASARTPMIQS